MSSGAVGSELDAEGLIDRHLKRRAAAGRKSARASVSGHCRDVRRRRIRMAVSPAAASMIAVINAPRPLARHSSFAFHVVCLSGVVPVVRFSRPIVAVGPARRLHASSKFPAKFTEHTMRLTWSIPPALFGTALLIASTLHAQQSVPREQEPARAFGQVQQSIADFGSIANQTEALRLTTPSTRASASRTRSWSSRPAAT